VAAEGRKKMRKTLVIGALAGLAIVSAGIAGAASTSSGSPADGPGGRPGMMGPGGGGFMGHPGMRRGMMDGMWACRDEQQAPKDGKRAGPPTRAELDACFTKVFGEMDANHDGKVTEAEAKAWREAQKAKREDAMFKRMDKNGDGALTKDEMFGKALAHFDAMDTNHDGVISPDERKAAMASMREKWKDHDDQKGGDGGAQ
jgi:Ca2+-binding EF-hand superfamily protein